MFEIGKLFHLAHVVDDLVAAVKYLERKGRSAARSGRERVVLQAKEAFGIVLGFNSR